MAKWWKLSSKRLGKHPPRLQSVLRALSPGQKRDDTSIKSTPSPGLVPETFTANVCMKTDGVPFTPDVSHSAALSLPSFQLVARVNLYFAPLPPRASPWKPQAGRQPVAPSGKRGGSGGRGRRTPAALPFPRGLGLRRERGVPPGPAHRFSRAWKAGSGWGARRGQLQTYWSAAGGRERRANFPWQRRAVKRGGAASGAAASAPPAMGLLDAVGLTLGTALALCALYALGRRRR